MKNGLEFPLAELAIVIHIETFHGKTISHPNAIVKTHPHEKINARKGIDFRNLGPYELSLLITVFHGQYVG